jgi:hypothetical protein
MALALGKEVIFVEKKHPGAKGGQCQHILVEQNLPDKPEQFHGYKYQMQERWKGQCHCPHLHKKSNRGAIAFFDYSLGWSICQT